MEAEENPSEDQKRIRELEAQVRALSSRQTFHVGSAGALILTYPMAVSKEYVRLQRPVADLLMQGWRLLGNCMNGGNVTATNSWQVVPPEQT